MKYLMLLSFIFLLSCQSKSKFEELDLMSNGLPIKIHAPAESVVKTQDIGGIFKDVTIKSGDEYYLQITSSEALSRSAAERASELKSDIQKFNYFSKIMEEEDQGFIFEKNVGDEKAYDFRYVRIQGDNEYIFQTGLMGKFTLEQVKDMYEAVQ